MDTITFEQFTYNMESLGKEFREYLVKREFPVNEPFPLLEWEELFDDFIAELWPSTDDSLPF